MKFWQVSRSTKCLGPCQPFGRRRGASLFPPESRPLLQLLADIGVSLLLFQVGMEFDFGGIFGPGLGAIAAVSLAGIIAPTLGGLCAGAVAS